MAGSSQQHGARLRCAVAAPAVTVGDVENSPVTVPAAVVAAYMSLCGTGLDREQVARSGRRLGNRVECDLELLAASAGADAAARLGAYAHRVAEFTRRFQAGIDPGAYAVLTRPLTSARQADSKHGRHDLADEIAALATVAGVGALVEHALGSNPDWDLLEAGGAPYTATVEHDGNDTIIGLCVEAAVMWPEPLGGPAAPNEIARHLVLHVNHAPWRDRRNRRLVAVHSTAEEIWPVTGTTPAF